MKYAILASVVLLAACGADGLPRHVADAPSGIIVSGEVLLGVRKTL